MAKKIQMHSDMDAHGGRLYDLGVANISELH